MNSIDSMWKYGVEESGKKNAQFLFFHIPKTGGTTFRYVLYNHFENKDLYPSQTELITNGGRYVNLSQFVKDKNYLNKKMLIGHFRVNVLEQIRNKHLKKLAFFRNPLDRILSTIKHIRAHDQELQGQGVNAILEKRYKQIVFGQSLAMGYDPAEKNMEDVRKNIMDLDFIGITEYFDESLKLCNATFNWKLENIAKHNVSKESIFGQLSSESKMRIVSDLSPEINAYNVALNHFKRRCKKKNIIIGK